METPRSANNTDEDPSLRIESSAIINLRDVSTKLNKYIIFTMQTYKKLILTLFILDEVSDYIISVEILRDFNAKLQNNFIF